MASSCSAGDPFDTLVLPVGDGALIAGVAPSMALSWRARRPVSTERSDTIAEGIEVRVPVQESVTRLVALVDDMVLVEL